MGRATTHLDRPKWHHVSRMGHILTATHADVEDSL